MSATETLKHGTEVVAETTTQAASELAELARKQAEIVVGKAADLIPRRPKKRHKGRIVLGAALISAAAAWAAKLGRKVMQDRRQQQEVIDLTLGTGSDGTAATVAGAQSGSTLA